MANWRSFGDRLLYCHRSTLKSWCNSSNPASFRNFRTRGCGGGGNEKAGTFLRIPGCCSCSPPPVSRPSLSSAPLLLLQPMLADVDESNSKDYFHFFSLSEQNQFRVGKNLMIPWQRDLVTPDDALCVGSSHGWLAFNHPLNGHTYLYNPLIDSPNLPYIPLPSVETIPDLGTVCISFKYDRPSSTRRILVTEVLDGYDDWNWNPNHLSCFHVQKLVMSSAPSVPCYSFPSSSSSLESDCTIMAIISLLDNIAFCKPGNHRWTALDGSLHRYSDIMYFSKDQRFYALECDSTSIEAWDLRDPSCPQNQVFDSPEFCPGKLQHKLEVSKYKYSQKNYLVESSGDLLLLCRFVGRRLDDDEEGENYIHHHWTLGFDVHKFDFNHNKWEVVECLDDRTLFVGYSNHSFSLSTHDYPELIENSIYFTKDHGDNGVFHLEDNSVKPFYPNKFKTIDSNPIWIAPNTM